MAWERDSTGLMGLASDWVDYLIDSAQRMALTVDILRQRGNQYVEHAVLGRPPVLTFPYETVMDGRTLPDPVNYQLLRIIPDAGNPTDPSKRPIVVVDPRAGHGPGIGGFKPDSQIGLALAGGYPCYFVSFLPEPVPGQTIADVARAEEAFLEEVAARHPQAEDRPVVIGNCQAGWAVAILSAVAPALMSVVILNGAPLSYWSGDIGRNPMRYMGGLLGGSWPAALSSDLGNGRFDGANLVSNFEFLDPANTLWKKPYNLYAKADTEGPRFLEFERWWGGYFLMNKAEIDAIVEDLFIGNRLAAGEIGKPDGQHVELRKIKAPIVVFCSKGDNITPPQQALNWILDVYESIEDLRANGQVIVYLVHESIGHLGIFVSTKVAKREHRAMIDNLDVISALPPGLYEMQVEQAAGGKGWDVAFAKRDLDDIRALGGERREEPYFLPVARVSQFYSTLYEGLLSPWVRAASSEASAELQRRANINRLRRYLWSDINPAMAGFAQFAEVVRHWRRPADDANLFRRAERRNGDMIAEGLDHFRDWRDRLLETLFFATYLPLRAATLGEERRVLEREAQGRANRRREAMAQLEHQARQALAKGGAAEAVLRIALYLTRRRPFFQAARFRLAERALTRMPQFSGLSGRDFRRMAREQAQVLAMDEQGAIAALAGMLPSAEDRQEVMGFIRAAAEEIGLDEDQRQDLERVDIVLAQPGAPAMAEAVPAPRPRARRVSSKPGGSPSLH